MGFFSEIGDFLKNPLDYVGDQLGEFNHQATKQSWDYQTQHSYTNTVKDLKNAGINPMVAYANGANSASVSQASVSQLPGVSDAMNSAQALLNMKKTALESELVSHNARSSKANADIESAVAEKILSKDSNVDLLTNKRLTPTSPTQAVGAGVKTIIDNAKDIGDSVVKGIENWASSVGNSAKAGSETVQNLGRGYIKGLSSLGSSAKSLND